MKLTKRVLSVLLVLVMLLPSVPMTVFAADTATVFFNPNGGTGGPGKVSATVGASLSVPSTNPTKSGMVFRGWATTAENAATGNIAYMAGSAVSVSGDMTLYASYAYTVVLKCGNEGAGTASKTLYKFPAKELALYHDKASIKSNYGMYPKNNDQRSFIQWNTKQDSTTSKGTGVAYWQNYNTNASVTLYAIWGYAISYHADGGVFPKTQTEVFKAYVCDCDDNNYQNPKTLYGNFDFPQGDNTPTKEGCRLVTMSGTVFYGLLYSDMSFFTTETAAQNLTIPPTGGKLPWSTFHTTVNEDGNAAPEFYAIWEPSVTYKANGGSGSDIVEWITWDWYPVHVYDSYTVRSNSFTKSGASFRGWNTEPDGSGTSYSAGSVINHTSSDPIVLYAQWSDGSHGARAEEKYMISFDANGGIFPPSAVYKYYGSVLKLPTATPTRQGYKFVGWSTDKLSGVVQYKAGDNYGIDAVERLYAVWEPCTSHSYTKTASSASTCTTQGKVTYTCSTCKQAYDEYLDYSHSWGNWIPNGDGTETRTCTSCSATESRVAPCAHEYDEGWVTKAATCKDYGVVVYTCQLCGTMYNDKLPMLEHSFTNYVSNNNATCAHGSTFTAMCDYGCGTPDTYIDESTKLDHVFTTYTPDGNATCTSGGTQTAYCDNGCGAKDTISYDGPTVGHKFSYYEYDNNATCGQDGTMTAKCDYGCGATDTKVKPNSATGDHLFYDYIPNDDATCMENGTMTALCEYGCGVSDTIKDMGSKLDHIYGEYVSDNNATCTSDGTMSAYCEYGCGTADKKYEKDTKIPHVFEEYNSNGDATCKEDGTKTAYCEYGCGITDTLPDAGSVTTHKYVDYTSNSDATCTEDGTKTASCKFGCGETETVTDEGSALGHDFGDWIVTTAPTTTEDGEETRYCSRCEATETQVVLKLGAPKISVDNYVITVTNADLIKDMRYAPGTYTTTTEIKAAEGNVAISNSLVKKYTVDGKFVYEMPNSGYFTFWIRMTDGEEYFVYADVTKFTPYVSAYGVKVTVHNLNNVKDFYIAKGEYNTYREIKDNGYIVSISANKIGAKHDYTYVVYEPGVHTVLIRYNDGTETVMHETLVVDEPVFTENGLQVIISNLPDVKVIRTAYGTWNTVKELKATDTIRNFSAKTAIKGKDPYTIQYREEGAVTIIVEYNNGYQKAYHYEVKQKEPYVFLEGTTMTLGQLDGLVVVRYAEGYYTSSNQVKNAPGSQYVRPSAAVDGFITIEGLKYGTGYTFVIQYNDETFIVFYVETEEARPEGTYVMTMDPNGGTMPEGYELKYYFYPQQRFQDVIGGYPVPTREGYTFYAWERVDYPHDHTWEGGWGTQPYTFDHDVTLRALWIKN